MYKFGYALVLQCSMGLSLSATGVAARDFERTFVVGSTQAERAERFETLEEFNSKVSCLRPGDRVLLEAGRTFNGSLRLRACPGDAATDGTIEIRSYDPKSPDDPSAARNPARIDGSVQAKSWGLAWKPVAKEQLPVGFSRQAQSLAVYSIGPIPAGEVVEVFHNTTRLLSARAPNDPGNADRGRYFIADAVTDSPHGCESAVCIKASDASARAALASLQSSGKGADLYAIVRTSPWSLGSSPASRIDGSAGVLMLAKPVSGSGMPAASLPGAGYGFVLVRAPALLDSHGEWYFDPGTRTLYLGWNAGEPAPTSENTSVVLASKGGTDQFTHGDAGLAFWGTDPGKPAGYTLTITNLTVVRSAGHAMRVFRAPNVKVSNVRINQPGQSGILVSDATASVLIENSTVLNAADNGVLVSSSREVIIRGNTINDAGRIANQRQFGMDFNGIRAAGFARALVSRNEVTGTGYAGIMLAEPPTGDSLATRVEIEVSGNKVSAFCNLLNDCGAIYINGRQKKDPPEHRGAQSMKRITANEIRSPIGNLDGAPGRNRAPSNERSKNGAFVRMVGAVYLDHQASGYDISDNRISGVYEPYGWRVFNKGTLNSCSRSTASACVNKGGYACYTDALDKCNSASPNR